MSDFLVHHGVKGMHWGVWNDQTRIRYAGGKRHVNASMMENLKNARTSNIDKWGTNRDQNVLYITGLSGSGKSTVTEGLRDNNTNVIHLDFYTNVGAKSIAAKAYRDKEFNEHLRKNCPEFFDKYHGEMPALSKMSKSEREDFWRMMDKFQDAMVSFGKKQYGNKRVIVEGVQLIDETFFPDKTFFKDQPLIVLSTDADTSLRRGLERDNVEVSNEQMIKIRESLQEHWGKQLADLVNTSQVKLGEEYVKRLINK